MSSAPSLTSHVTAFKRGKGWMDLCCQSSAHVDLFEAPTLTTSLLTVSAQRAAPSVFFTSHLSLPASRLELQQWAKPPAIQTFKKSQQNNYLCFDGKLLLTTKHSRKMLDAPGMATKQIIHLNCSDTQLVGIAATPGKPEGQKPVHIKNR